MIYHNYIKLHLFGSQKTMPPNDATKKKRALRPMTHYPIN